MIAVTIELVEIGLLEGEAPRWTRAWQLEELVESGQSNKAVQIALSELGADVAGFVVRDDIDARIANALGIANAQLGNTHAALSLYERVIAGGWRVSTALLRAGNVYAAEKRYPQAEESYISALERLVHLRMINVEDAETRGALRTRHAVAWHVPFNVALDNDEDDSGSRQVLDDETDIPQGEPASISLIFLEGEAGDASDDAVDLFEFEDGQFGALIEPDVGLGLVWTELAELYLSAGRLDEAQTAANTGGAIAEILGDNDGMSRAFDVLAGIGMQRGDPEFLRMTKSANRELLEMAAQTGHPPSRLRASLRLGWYEVNDGHLGRAAAAFRDAQRLASDIGDRVSLASSLLGAADVARQEERTDDASAALLAAIAEYELLKDDASIASTRHQQGDLFVEAAKPELALDALETARLLFVERGDLAGEAGVRESMARAAALEGNYADADDQLRTARSLAGRYGDPRVAVSVELTAGALLEERHEFGAAVDVYRGALTIAAGPLYQDLRALCHLNIGDAELNREDYRTAVDEYSEAAKTYSQINDTVNEFRARGALVIALAMGRDGSAIDLADELVASLSPDLDQLTRSTVHLAQARALTELGRHGDALAVLSDPAIAVLGIDPAVQRLELLSSIGRFADVIAQIDTLLERDPYRADFHALKGWSFLNLDPPEAAAAQAAYSRAKELEPDNPWHQKNLVSCLLGLQRQEEALALAGGVIARLSRPQLEDLSTDLLSLLGFVLYQAGEYAMARKHLAVAVERDVDDAVSDLDLALVEMCARSDGAEDHYARAVDKLASVNPERRRGILIVALRDVQNAVRWGRVGDPTVAGRIANLIRSRMPAVS